MPGIFENDPFGDVKEPVESTSPEPRVVNRFHDRSDADVSKTAQHHTLGPGANQASPGDHLHDGRDSKHLLDGQPLDTSANASYTQAQIQQIIDALVKLGAG